MYILYGIDIHNGARFLGPYKTEQEAEQVKHAIDFDEQYEDLATDFHWHIIELCELDELRNIIAQGFTQVI